MNRWYVVNTVPHQEARADLNLKRQGYEVWLPATSRVRRHARRVETVRAPLFPSYMFVKFDVERDPWSSINGTFGVRRLLCHGERPTPLPVEFVDALAASVDAEGLVANTEPALLPGQKLSILAGPFADCVATLVRIDSRDRVAVLLEILGREVATVLPRRIVMPV